MMRMLFWRAATRLAADPRVQAKASELFEREVKPRAVALGQRVKPTVQAVREEVGEAAREADPLEDPKGFASELKDRFDKHRKR